MLIDSDISFHTFFELLCHEQAFRRSLDDWFIGFTRRVCKSDSGSEYVLTDILRRIP